MTDEEYIDILKEQNKCITEEIKKEINEQVELSKVTTEKRNAYYASLDKEIELLKVGCDKFFAKYPEFKGTLSTQESLVGASQEILLKAINNPSYHSDIVSKMKEIPELKKHGEMVTENARIAYEYLEAASKLNERIDKSRETLFSMEYKEKMDKLADEGVFLYFLETPDFPLLEKDYDAKMLIDSFYYGDCLSLKALLYAFMQMRNDSPSMFRKTDDLYACVELMIDGFYRTAARNLFALLDSEHKKCAEAFEGFYQKRKTYRNGLQRANKIKDLIDKFDIKWNKKAWEKIDAYYKKIVSTEKVLGVVHRNTIVHGDYQDNDIDVSKDDCMKLMLLWVNMRLIADWLCNTNELYEILIGYLPGAIYNMVKDKN